MSFLYPRTIDVRRPNAHAALPRALHVVATAGYGGVMPSDETTFLRDIPASIQLAGSAGQRHNPLPADTNATGAWNVFIPRHAAKQGQIKQWDIIVDEDGARFQVTHPYHNSLGYKLRCHRLTV